MRSLIIAAVLCLIHTAALADGCLPNCVFPAGTFDVGTVTLTTGARIVGEGPVRTRLRGTLVADGGSSTVRDVLLRDFTWEGPVTLRRFVDGRTDGVRFENGAFSLEQSWSNRWVGSSWRNAPMHLFGGSNAQSFVGCRWSPGAGQTTPMLVWDAGGTVGTFLGGTVDGGTTGPGFEFNGWLASVNVIGVHFEAPRPAIRTTGPMQTLYLAGNFFTGGDQVPPLDIGDCNGVSLEHNSGFAPGNSQTPTTPMWACGNNAHILHAEGNKSSGTMVVP